MDSFESFMSDYLSKFNLTKNSIDYINIDKDNSFYKNVLIDINYLIRNKHINNILLCEMIYAKQNKVTIYITNSTYSLYTYEQVSLKDAINIFHNNEKILQDLINQIKIQPFIK